MPTPKGLVGFQRPFCLTWCHHPTCPEGIEPEELEDYLASLLDQEFDTIVEDGSLQRVSVSIHVNESYTFAYLHLYIINNYVPRLSTGELLGKPGYCYKKLNMCTYRST